MTAFEEFFKYGGGLVAIGTVIFMAGKLSQVVDFLKQTVEEIRSVQRDHEIRLAAVETKRAGRRKYD